MLRLTMNKGAASLVTRLALASVYVKLFLEAAAPAIGMAVVADRGAACKQRIFEHALDARAKPLRSRFASLALRKQPCLGVRRHTGPEQRLADIDIAKPCNDALVEEKGFERLRLARSAFREIGRREVDRKRLDPESPEQRMLRHVFGKEKRHIAEAAHIVITDDIAVAHAEHDMVVARIGVVIVVKRPGRLSAFRGFMKDRKPPGHAEMHGQTEPAFRFRDDVLGAAREAGHALAQKPRCEIRLEGKAQVGAIERDGFKRGVFHGRGKAAPDDLHFGQFGHGQHLPQRGRLASTFAVAFGGGETSLRPLHSFIEPPAAFLSRAEIKTKSRPIMAELPAKTATSDSPDPAKGSRMISYRSEIDGIRAIAIASVVLFHGWSSAFPGGYVGVDIFFVISGYLITSIIFNEMKAGKFTYLSFYARRARRILPALLAMIAITTIAAFLLFLPDDLIEYGKMVIYTMLFGGNFRLAAEPGYFHHSMQENPLLHMWSLSVEEQFYLIWPTLLALMIRFLPERRHRLAVLALGVLSLAAAEALVHIWPRSAFFHLPTRGWELLAGALLAMNFVPRISSKAVAESLSAIGLAMMIAPLFLYDKDTPFPGLAALVPVLGCALVIYSTDNERTRVAALLSWKPVVFTGLISYSLYLWHWPIFAVASYELMRPLTFLESLFCVIVAVSAAVFSWRFIEQPFRKPAKRPAAAPLRREWFFIPSIGRAGQFAIALTALIIACGSFFQESKGAAWRLPTEARIVLDRVGKFAQCAPKKTGPDFKECEFGDRPADLVLWGDSHAQHYLPLITKIYGSGTSFFSGGCLPLQNAQLINKSGRPFTEGCQKNNRYALERILALKPKIVVMASRWTQIEDLPYGREGRPTLYLATADGETTREASRRTFARALDQTVSTLRAAGIKVVLMGQVPEMLLSPARCFAPFQHPSWNDCGFVTRQEADRRQGFVNSTLKSVTENHRGVFYFSPFSEFCDSSYCYAIKDRSLHYFDNDHINIDGAIMLVDAFRRSLPQAFQLPSATQTLGPSPSGTNRG
jgi:peptidoglycan/LPS O-acetylase OafA/YrhL